MAAVGIVGWILVLLVIPMILVLNGVSVRATSSKKGIMAETITWVNYLDTPKVTCETSADDFVTADFQLMLIGKTGNGKSASGNTILNSTVFKEQSGPRSVTKTVKAATGYRDSYELRVCDTPGLFDSHASMNTIIENIFECFDKMPPGPHAILITLSAKSRYTEEEHETLEKIMDIFGKEVMNHAIICVTHTDEYPLEKYLKWNTNSRFNEILKQAGRRVIGVNNRDPSSFQFKKLVEFVKQIKQNNVEEPFFTLQFYDNVALNFQKKNARHKQEFQKIKAEVKKHIPNDIDGEERMVLLETCRQIMKLKQNLCSILRDWRSVRERLLVLVNECIQTEHKKRHLAKKFRVHVGVSQGIGSLVGGGGAAYAGGKAGVILGAKAGALLGPVGATIGAVAGGVVGAAFAGLAGAEAGRAILQEIVGTKYKSDGLGESAITIILHTDSKSSVADAFIKTENFMTFKDKIKALYEIDQFQTKALNDEIVHVKPATLALKEDLPWFVAEKVKADVFKKFSPIDEHFTGLEEVEAVHIDFSDVERMNFRAIYAKLEQGLYQGEDLLTDLCE